MKMNRESKFDYFYNHSALTIEGLKRSEQTERDFTEWLKHHGAVENDKVTFHWITGKEMNMHYGLTDDNAYPDKLNIVVVEPTDIHLEYIIFSRIEIGGRWFDDVVDNNARRQELLDARKEV